MFTFAKNVQENILIKNLYETMKTNYFLIIIFTLLIACNNNDNKQNEDSKNQIEVNFTKFFTGAINGKYKIQMTLTKEKEKLTGSYNYISKKIPINISGTIDKQGNIVIQEFNKKGNLTGIFKGQYSNNKIIGNWEKPDGSKIMPFNLEENLNNDMLSEKHNIKKTRKENNPMNWSGTYESKYGQELKITESLEKGEIKFVYKYMSERCADLFEETARLVSNDVAYYYIEDSKIKIKLFNNGNHEIKVTVYNYTEGELTCSDMSGIYKIK